MALSKEQLDQIRALATKRSQGKTGEIKAAQSGDTSTKGEETVAQALERRLRAFYDLAGVHRRASQYSMSSRIHKLSSVASSASVSLVSENGTISPSDMTFGQGTLTAKKLAARILVSTELVDDAGTEGGISDSILRDVSHSFSKEVDKSLLVGGLLGSGISGDASVTASSVASVAALTLDDITASLVAYGEKSSSDPVVVVNPKLYFGPIADLLMQAGIQQQVHDGKHYLFGHEVLLSSVMAGPSSSTSGDCLLIAGHLGCRLCSWNPQPDQRSRESRQHRRSK